MLKKINKNDIKVTIGVLIVFIGICIIGSTYFNTKKLEVFDDMNEEYYEQIIADSYLNEEQEEITEEEKQEVVEEDTTTELEIETQIKETTKPVTTTTRKKVSVKTQDYSKYYVGTLNIPKIELKRGFMDIKSKYNNVNRNIYVSPESEYPDVVGGNLILAAHSGTSSISFFKNLYKLELNDEVYITYKNKKYTYKITKIYTDNKDGDVVIKRNKNKTTLTLITCTKNNNETQTIYICELV